MTQRTKTKIKFLTKDEVTTIISKAANLTERALMETLFSTGLRITECIKLDRNQIQSTLETQEISIVGKGSWQRVVYFSPQCLQSLHDYLNARTDTDSRLFPFTTRTAERIVAKASRASNLRATPHTFRHSLATHILRQGANIRVVQEMLGHRAISSTMVYTGVTNKDLLEAHKRFL